MGQNESASSAHSSVTDWLNRFQRGDVEAACKIWKRYVEQVVRAADRRLKDLPRSAAGAEDVAQEVFLGFFRGVAENRFPKLGDRHDLWQLLFVLTERRAIDLMRKILPPPGIPLPVSINAPAGGSEHEFAPPAPPVDPDSTDELIRVIQRTFPQLADHELQQIAMDRFANYSVAEIANRRGIAVRTVERKLALIRKILRKAAEDEK